jgi:general secretion pathway protein K
MANPHPEAAHLNRPSRRGDERGIALIMVIWMLAVLSLIAASFLAEARVEVRRAGNLIARARAEALADAGVQLAIARLMRDGGGEVPDPWSEPLSGGSVRITVADERGKIDLNGADRDLLAGLFSSHGATATEASAIAAAVIDFRDPDHDAQVNGAEDADYAAEGIADGAKDAPFQSVEELLQVRGVTPELFAAVEPLLTVHTGANAVDPLRADAAVLGALPGIDRRELDRFLKVRGALKASSLPRFVTGANATGGQAAAKAAGTVQARLTEAMPAMNGVGRFLAATDTALPTFLIEAEAVSADDGHFSRRAVVRLTQDASQPFIVLAWDRPYRPD